ncbi:MAG: sulfur oxidation c-type cytochrome SoxX [Gammaproteobacteria bacterium]|nr:sulfur oxidation c-type cytochrome SoxX [Gammaproteobacteria bacterium]
MNLDRLKALFPVLVVLLLTTSIPFDASAGGADDGKKLAFDRKKGNCLACHQMADGASPGNIGPPLVSIKARFPDQAKLRAQVSDATVANPESIMPAFGKYHALSDAEIDAIVSFLYTL